MDWINSLNTIVGLIGGIFGLGGYLFGAVTFLRNKAKSAQQKQTVRLVSSHQQSSTHVATRTMNKLDWMEVLWYGLEDCLKARGGAGWIYSFGIGLFGGLIIAMFAPIGGPFALSICLVIFYLIFLTINLLFYLYFVGRRIEEKIETLNTPSIQKFRKRSNN